MANTILFDLDGTLTDPKIGITKSVSYALGKFNIRVSNEDSLTDFIGPPLKQSFHDFYSFDESKSEQAVIHYREYFSKTGKYENTVYDGIPSLLEYLTNNHYQLAVSTSKPTIFARDILDHFKLSQFFTTIVGSNLDNTRTEKREIIAHTIEQLQCNKEQCIMIGDRFYDIEGAKLNSIPSIAVLYGYGSMSELSSAGPTYISADITELREIIEDHFG